MRRTGSEVIAFFPITLVKFRREALDLNAKTAGPLWPEIHDRP